MVAQLVARLGYLAGRLRIPSDPLARQEKGALNAFPVQRGQDLLGGPVVRSRVKRERDFRSFPGPPVDLEGRKRSTAPLHRDRSASASVRGLDHSGGRQ